MTFEVRLCICITLAKTADFAALLQNIYIIISYDVICTHYNHLQS